MFHYAIGSFKYILTTFEGIYTWPDDSESNAENPVPFSRFHPPCDKTVTPEEKSIREMTCVNHQKDTLFLESNDTANLSLFIQNFEEPEAIKTIKIINDANNPLLMGSPEFLDLLDAFQYVTSFYIDNCQNIFDAESDIIVCEKVTKLSLTNLFNIDIPELELIAQLFPNLQTLTLSKCRTINHIDDNLELMIDLFSKTEIISIEDTTYILDRV